MMTPIVTACSSFGLMVSAATTGITCLHMRDGARVPFTIVAAGQVYNQMIEFAYLGRVISANRDLSVKITRRIHRVQACFQRYYNCPEGALTIQCAVA